VLRLSRGAAARPVTAPTTVPQVPPVR